MSLGKTWADSDVLYIGFEKKTWEGQRRRSGQRGQHVGQSRAVATCACTRVLTWGAATSSPEAVPSWEAHAC